MHHPDRDEPLPNENATFGAPVGGGPGQHRFSIRFDRLKQTDVGPGDLNNNGRAGTVRTEKHKRFLPRRPQHGGLLSFNYETLPRIPRVFWDTLFAPRTWSIGRCFYRVQKEQIEIFFFLVDNPPEILFELDRQKIHFRTTKVRLFFVSCCLVDGMKYPSL